MDRKSDGQERRRGAPVRLWTADGQSRRTGRLHSLLEQRSSGGACTGSSCSNGNWTDERASSSFAAASYRQPDGVSEQVEDAHDVASEAALVGTWGCRCARLWRTPYLC